MKWEELPLADRAKLMAVAVKNGYTDIRSIKLAYANFLNLKLSTGNMYSKGGDTDNTYEPEVVNPLDNLPEWKALEHIDFTAIPDPEFTREKTGAGSIEYFSAEEPEGITYTNGYHRDHPMPGKDVILYNPNDNDAQDIRLDALHIMPKDPTYDALNTIYRNASWDARDDNYINAIDRYTTDKAKQATRYVIDKATGKDTNDRYYGTDPFMLYFNNEADGTLRSLLMEGDENYRESKRYWGNKDEVRELNVHLMPYINDIQRYLETGERPPHVLPNLEVTDQMAYGGNLFDKGGKKKSKGSSTVGERMSFIEQELVRRGVSPVLARAVAANVMVESGGNPQAYNKSSGARGLAQWLGSRKPKSWSMEDQLDYLAATCNKLGGNEWINKAAWKRFNETNDPAEAARLFRRYWERPEASSWYATDKYFGINSKNSYLSDDVNNLVWKMSNLQYNKPRTVTFTKEDQKLLDTSPLQFVKPDYDNEEESSKRAARQKELDNFANSIMLNEDLYKPSSVDNLAFLLNTLGGGTPQSPSDSYNWFTSLLTPNPKATPQQLDNAALYQLFAPYGDGGLLYHGLNFAAYSKPNKFGEGGPYNDEFMKDYGYRWVPASEILLSDPYFNDIQQHDSNGMYAVDKNGFYVPASRLRLEWEKYNSGQTINGPETAIPLNEVVHTLNDKDKQDIRVAKQLWGDARKFAYENMSNSVGGIYYKGRSYMNNLISPNEIIRRLDTINQHSTYPRLHLRTVDNDVEARHDKERMIMPDGRLRAHFDLDKFFPWNKGGNIYVDAGGKDFLSQYIAELAHNYQYTSKDINNPLLIGEYYTGPDYDDVAYHKSDYNEFRAHRVIQPTLLDYISNIDIFGGEADPYYFNEAVQDIKNDLLDINKKKALGGHLFNIGDQITKNPHYESLAYGGKVNKFDGESGSSNLNNSRIITLAELPQEYVTKYGHLNIVTPSGVKMPLSQAYRDYNQTRVNVNDVPGLTDYLIKQDQPEIAIDRWLELRDQHRANQKFNHQLDLAAIGTMLSPVLGVAGAEVAPFLAPGTVGGTLIGETAGGMAMGELLNKGTEMLTGRNWGDNVRNTLENTFGYNPESWSSFGQGAYNIATDMTNPGYYNSRLLKSGINAGELLLNRAKTLYDNGTLWDKYTTFGGRFGYYGDTPMDRFTGTIQRRFNIGTPKASNPELLRKIGQPIMQQSDGLIVLSSPRFYKDGNQIENVNFTMDRFVVPHKNGTWDLMDGYIIDPELVNRYTFQSIEPSDMFNYGSHITTDPTKVTLVSGNVASLLTALNQGLSTLSSPKLRRLYQKILDEAVRRSNLSKLELSDLPPLNRSQLALDYASEMQRLKSTRGNPTYNDFKLLELRTGLNSFVQNNEELTQYNNWINRLLLTKNDGTLAQIPFEDTEFVFPNGRTISTTDVFARKYHTMLPTYTIPYNNVLYDPATQADALYRLRHNIIDK